jgi:hypothetical protein
VTAESSSTGVWTSPKISPSSSPVPSASWYFILHR